MRNKIFTIFLFLAALFIGLIVWTLKFSKKPLHTSTYSCTDCNVILITLTNLRYDHMSGNGYTRPTTPSLDALGKESLVFDNAFSHSSWTLPEGVSIFTSLYPYQHGIMNRFDGSTLSKNTPSLIDILASNGYQTAGFTGGFDYDPRFGLTNRYGEYQGCTGDAAITTLGYGNIGCTIGKALIWIKHNRQAKFFVQIQGYDAHCPFSQRGGTTYDKSYKGKIDFSHCLWTFDKTAPITKNGRTYYPVFSSKTGVQETILLSDEDVHHLIALYDEGITQSDALIGSFLGELKAMGLDANTIIIFTSEHGDMFGKYGIFMRSGPLRGEFYDDVLHVPLIMKIPNVKPARYRQLVEHIDIAPTLLDVLSLQKPPSFAGASLTPVFFENKDIHEQVFAGSEYHPGIDNVYFNESTRVEAIRTKEWKFIKETVTSQDPPTSTLELFHLTQDREELHNVADSYKNILYSLEQELSDWSDKMRYENK